MKRFTENAYNIFPYLSVIVPLLLSYYSDKYLNYGWTVLFINCFVSMLHVIHVANWFQDKKDMQTFQKEEPYKFSYLVTTSHWKQFDIKIYSPFRFSYFLHFITAIMLGIVLMGLLGFIPYLQQHLNLCNQISFIAVSYYLFYELLATREITCDESKIVWCTKYTGITRTKTIYINDIDEILITFTNHENNSLLNFNKTQFQFYSSVTGKNIVMKLQKLDEQQQEIIWKLFIDNYPHLFKEPIDRF